MVREDWAGLANLDIYSLPMERHNGYLLRNDASLAVLPMTRFPLTTLLPAGAGIGPGQPSSASNGNISYALRCSSSRPMGCCKD